MALIPIEKSDFLAAQERIRGSVMLTPLTYLEKYSLHLKWESHQPTKSFKVRGAFNRMLADKVRPERVMTGSAGNHGLAVALAAREMDIQAVVFVPEGAPRVKVDKIRELGATVERVPGLFGDAEAKAIHSARKEGVPFISAYNDRDVIAGAGTIALEVLDQAPIERILVPVGGGGLIAGMGLCAKSINPGIEIIGVLSEASPYLFHEYYFGSMENVKELPTLTDGLAGAVEAGSITIDLIHSAADAVIQVTEKEIAAAVVAIYRETGEIVEGSAAVGLAAVMSTKVDSSEKKTAAILTGANIDRDKFEAILVAQNEIPGSK